LEGDELICTFTTFDPDNDALTTRMTWGVNGVVVAENIANITTAILPNDVIIIAEDETVPFVGMIGTVAALGAGLLVAIRRESEE
jgi:hypothetical protein